MGEADGPREMTDVRQACRDGSTREGLRERARSPLSTLPRPFLKWAGSKRAHLLPVVELLPAEFGRYWEPFLGSGALFFLLSPIEATLADICSPLIETFRSVRDDPAAVLAHVAPLPVEEATFYELRAAEFQGRHQRAAQFIYLNKTCWNGLYRVNSQGRFNVPFGRPKSANVVAPDILRSCSRALRSPGVHLEVGDFAETLASVTAGDLVFLDPPYVTGHNNNGFVEYNERLFSWHDQERLASLAVDLAASGVHVIVTNAAHYDVVALYPGFESITFTRKSTLASSTARRGAVREAILYSIA
jgi:DNA adenine methylase